MKSLMIVLVSLRQTNTPGKLETTVPCVHSHRLPGGDYSLTVRAGTPASESERPQPCTTAETAKYKSGSHFQSIVRMHEQPSSVI